MSVPVRTRPHVCALLTPLSLIPARAQPHLMFDFSGFLSLNRLSNLPAPLKARASRFVRYTLAPSAVAAAQESAGQTPFTAPQVRVACVANLSCCSSCFNWLLWACCSCLLMSLRTWFCVGETGVVAATPACRNHRSSVLFPQWLIYTLMRVCLCGILSKLVARVT